MRASHAVLILSVCALSAGFAGGSEEEDLLSRAIAELPKIEEEGRLVACAALAGQIRGEIFSRWIRQVEAALPAAPEGWACPGPDDPDSYWGPGGAVVTRIYRRGEDAELRIQVDLEPNPNTKPFDGNLVWIQYVRAGYDKRASEVRFAGRQAWLGESEDGRGQCLGLALAHGATLSVVTRGTVSREEILGTFGGSVDLGAVESRLWRYQEGAFTPWVGAASLAELWASRRLGEAHDMAGRLREYWEQQASYRIAALLPPAPAGWTAEDVAYGGPGGERVYRSASGGTVKVWLGLVPGPDVNGWYTAFRRPDQRQKTQSVATVGRLPVLLDEYLQYGDLCRTARAFFLDGTFHLSASAVRLPPEEWLEPLLGGLDPEAMEAELAKLR